MGYRTLRECVDDLERHRRLVRIDAELDARLEVAEIQRRVCAAGGPALLFTRVRGCRFPMVSNLFGTLDRARFLFRDTLADMQRLVELKTRSGWHCCESRGSMPVRRDVRRRCCRSRLVGRPLTANETTISELPQQISWPEDGGAFITLPQVYTEDARRPVCRIRTSACIACSFPAASYQQDREIGLHYQIQRSIGVHHAAAIAAGKPFRVNIFVGGPPAMMLAAVMPLPEGLSELAFAGALARRRMRMFRAPIGLPIHADADFCICGTVVPGKLLPEGPFGDHFGYYSRRHDFPVLRGRAGLSSGRRDLAVHGRRPTAAGGYRLRAVDSRAHRADDSHRAAGRAGGSRGRRGRRSSAALGDRQRTVLALRRAAAAAGIAHAGQCDPRPGSIVAGQVFVDRVEGGRPRAAMSTTSRHSCDTCLQRVDWTRDLHFQTETTIDTLDYSGGALNAGSKLVIAAVGPRRFELATAVPSELRLPEGFRDPRVVLPGVLAIEGPRCDPPTMAREAVSDE